VITDPNSKIAQEIRGVSQRIAVGVAPISEAQTRKTLWGSLFKKEQAQSRVNFQNVIREGLGLIPRQINEAIENNHGTS
jgi:hypothetical protein